MAFDGTRWSDETADFAMSAWRDGKSATEIRQELASRFSFAVTRNGVIGKVHRTLEKAGERVAYRSSVSPRRAAHMTRAPAKPRPPRPVKPPRERRVAQPAPPRPAPHPTPFLATVSARRTLELATRDCKFPVGEATGMDQLHCGEETAEGEVYCGPHRTVAGGGRIDSKLADKGAHAHRRYAWS